jgi:Protein of unknown function (DUF3352)
MRVPRKPSVLVLLSLMAIVAAALLVAGCGGGSGGSGGEPAGVAPMDAPVYISLNLAPEAKESEELDALTKSVLGIDNVGEFAAEQLEQAALGEGEKFNFEEEVEPWLGENAGMYLAGYDGNDFHGFGLIFETTDAGEAEEFIEKRVEANGEKSEEGEYEGDKYFVEPEDESVLGMVGDYLVFGEGKEDFEAMVEAFEGEGLNESAKYKTAMESASEAGVGSVYVDIGGLIEETKGAIPAETEAFFDLVQIEPKEATAVATVVPHSEAVEIDLSSNLGTGATGGDATALLESLPATATAGFASAEFGKGFGEGIDKLSEEGIPGQIEPGELEPALEAVGINLHTIFASIGAVGGFVEGTEVSNLGGAMVIETTNATEAKNTVANIGLLLRATGTKGVTAISGELSGFSVHSEKLGPQPLIVGATGEKIVVAYGPKAAARALKSNSKTLGSTADFEAAKGAIGSTPMNAFIDGGPGLKLVEGLLSPEDLAKIEGARPYLQKISYVAVGSEAKGKTTTAKVIVGMGK